MEKQQSFLPQAIISQINKTELMACNDYTKKYGLLLTEEETMQILERRKTSLQSYGRIEIGGGMLDKLIKEFCDSPYLNSQNYASTIAELTELFYYFKNEALDKLSDEELLKIMHMYFDGPCGGSLELLGQSALEQMTRHVRYGEAEYTKLEERGELYMGDDLNEY
ncbi:DUF6323 family protein [Cellulosilyticum ruminicola]|uniref:DUF6323 family protein n=1 Tax=Cellulosilyticum ruminicola TaxID=425254 RepID=UPI0006D0B880|nr:DUF6323 family protein [Cellulosilyticum ruminicola]